MVHAFVTALLQDPSVTRVQVDPAPGNARAIRCYEKVGFRAARAIVTLDGPALLMYCDRASIASTGDPGAANQPEI
jgi:RimJ/RimL family protein N-acetyltransferase